MANKRQSGIFADAFEKHYFTCNGHNCLKASCMDRDRRKTMHNNAMTKVEDLCDKMSFANEVRKLVQDLTGLDARTYNVEDVTELGGVNMSEQRSNNRKKKNK